MDHRTIAALVDPWVRHSNPHFVGWQVFVLSIIGAICMPISGFWIVIPQALYILKR
ncbi:DUF6463 family protein [Paenibacillus sp. GCM10027628]|uniref:DUF6463 family protein n=1 Tax=Paenibacillus sp. GCM10027628 TaxID=3273413 RepID=UPI003631461A